MAEHETGPGEERTGLEVAVVGMAGRFPGADDVHAFWRNLRAGVESVSRFSREALLETGADPRLLDHPDFVPVKGELRGADTFDATLFGLTPRDAEVLNPQHRVLLECAWAALEHAGYDPARVEAPVGIFAGGGTNTYVLNLASTPSLVRAVGMTRISLGNDKDHLAANVSYRLNLRGPALAVQTACSTSLVAVHLACQSLLNAECDVALAGGVSIQLPLRGGYLYAPDGILSPDGHCRAFDADARGSVGGSGAGLVVLKRLDDALADGDTIHAVIRGSAINNDGAQKVGYTAPSVTGQARVLSEAWSVAGVDPGTVQYLETHGTGTPLGDAIELTAMSQVLARGGGPPTAIGSVKSNVGHLDAAAGVAGLIKTVLALSHGEIPPSLNVATPHPQIEASGGHVFVNTELRPWERRGAPRRAGVSSFGLGGTNAHVVLEEAPAPEPSGPSRALQLLVVSARTATALAAAAENLADHLEREAPPLADAAFTLRAGRREMEHRLAVVCADGAEAAARLRQASGRPSSAVPRADRPVAFLFPGLGMHHVDMGRGLYDAEPAYRAAVDTCCALLAPVLGTDLREVMFSAGPAAGGDADASASASAGGGWDLRGMLARGEGAAPSPLDDTRFAQPAVFVTGYALAALWTSWGVAPAALLGHSLGEYVAACVAGVLTLRDALTLVALRARLIDGLPAGAMLAVPLGEAALRELLPPGLDLAAVNTPESCVVAGPVDAVEAFEAELAARGTVSRRLPTRHAFHSRMMAPVAAELERLVAGFTLRAPEIPFVSNVTGTWITDDEARSPAYWGRHLCQPVRFADGIATLRGEPGRVFLEVGPGQTLGAWAMQHPAGGAAQAPVVLSSLRHPHNRVPDPRFVLETLGGLWAAGVPVDWTAFGGDERRRRVPLPVYPFERRRYWVDAPRAAAAAPPEPPRAQAPEGEGAPPGPAAVEAAAPRAGVAAALREMETETEANAAAHAANGGHQKGPDVLDNPVATASRQDAILDRLKAIAAELTGIQPELIATDVHFFQAGIDSLLLLQAIQQVEKGIGVRVSLIELLEEITTLDALARHLDGALPPEVVMNGNGNGRQPHAPVPAEAPAPEPAAASASPRVPAPPALYPAPPPAAAAPLAAAAAPPAPGSEGALERVIAQQLQVMQHQIAALRGETAAPAALPASAPSAVPQASAASADAASADTAPADAASADAASADAASADASAAVPQSPRARIQPETFVAHQPMNTDGPGGMTPEQKAFVDDFIARYTERTRASKAHQVRYHLPLADGRVTARFRRVLKEIAYPIVGDRARGAYVWDADGNRYVDIGMAYGCNLFGHGPDFVSRAIQEQVERGYGVGPQSPLAGRAAELVCELGGVERAIFCNSGTEAVMGAIRAARTYTGRTRVAYFAGSYHGWSDIVQGRPLGSGERRAVRPTAPGISQLPLDDVLLLDWDQPSSLETLARHLDELAVVIVEPVQSRRLDIQPRAFLQELRRMTREAGVLLHFDELITGFRIGAGGAQAFFGVDADLVTYGKIVAGGLPMGVVGGTREVMSVFDGGLWSYGDDSYPTGSRTLFAGAFFKHPLSMGVVVAIMEEIRRRGPEMYEGLNARAAGLVDRCNAFFEAGAYPITAVRFGSVFRFFLGGDIKFPELFLHHMILEGVYVQLETGTGFLSLAHTDEDVETVFQAVCRSAEALRRGGLIPPAPEPAPPPEWRDDGVRVVPMTEGQRQLWLESQMGEAAARAYTESISLYLRGPVQPQAMHRAAQALTDRHDTLRTTFGPEGDEQRIAPACEVDFTHADFSGEPAEGRAAAVEAWIAREVRRPFHLEAGPLTRFSLATAGADEHVLAISSHHAVMDGWSFTILLRELGQLYAAAREGRDAGLPPLSAYADFARAQAGPGHRARMAAAEAFWAAQFADGVPALELPTDRPRPPVRAYRGERIEMTLSDGLVQRLVPFCRQNGFSVFHVLLSAFQLWLGRLSGQDDVVVGIPSAGQAEHAGATELVGYNINVLPLRGRLEPAVPFVEHAKRVRRSVARALEHQSFSFPRLVQRLYPRRDPSRPPLFSAMFNVDRRDGGELRLGELRATVRSNFTGAAKFDLNVNLVEEPTALSLYCDFDSDLFDEATVRAWLGGFDTLLDGIAARPDAPLAELELLGHADRARVLGAWSASGAADDVDAGAHAGADADADGTLAERFEARAAAAPDAVALIAGEETITFGALDARANRLARVLQARGVGAETVVGIHLDRSPEYAAAVLAVLKAGGAYLPLDPSYPADRLAYMLADSGAPVVVTDAAHRATLPVSDADVLDLDAAAATVDGADATAPARFAAPDGLAYLLYTSGSTGTPKPIGGTHRGVVNRCAWMEAAHPFAAGEVCCQKTAIGFVDSVWELFGPLLAGVPSVVLGPDDARDARRLAAAAERH
ncbi:aminotransferase class III-fold pyridoxal phosphate-dependent enzyme, partial [Longimicrobium sp.]|uniref:aminotransferase class III-fold pyridoxal phosphate-dependent enzyme n=1 Tax=Longimicrobium sp. TaxID=2029185 RepID=UPI002E301012